VTPLSSTPLSFSVERSVIPAACRRFFPRWSGTDASSSIDTASPPVSLSCSLVARPFFSHAVSMVVLEVMGI
jgi:hypothetical protein